MQKSDNMRQLFESLTIMTFVCFCCQILSGCDSSNLDTIGAEEVYFFEKRDTLMSNTPSIFQLNMDKESGSYPTDWEISALLFDSHENFDPRFYDDDNYYQVPSETVHKIDNGLAFNWLSVQKIIVGGEPGLRISVDANDTDKQRSAKIHIIRYHTNNKGWYVGEVKVTQKGKSAPEPFEMKIRYKGKVYTSPAYHDENGGIVIDDEEFRSFIEDIENRPGIEAVVMDDEIVDYFDNSDVEAKPALAMLRQSVDKNAHAAIRNGIPSTRADAFRYMGSEDVGYFAVFDDSGYSDSYIAEGFPSFTDYYDVDKLGRYNLNDKISSLAVAYKGTDPEVCAVLTVWEDSYFNHGDNDRTKHRISFIADHTNPSLTVKRLKNIKCINSSNSWNDRISSLSFHFGYFDTKLRDY